MASKHQHRPGYWRIMWVEGGRQRARALGRVTEAEAEAARIAVERELAGVHGAAGPTLTDWAVEYGQWRAAEYPDSWYSVESILRCHLLPSLGSLPIGAITRREVESYKQGRIAAGAAPGTVTKELRVLLACLRHAVSLEIIPAHRVTGVRAPQDLRSRPPRWLTREELQAVYRVELEPRKSQNEEDKALHRQYRWAWQLLANTGLRRGEALQLRWQNVGRDEIRVLSEPGARTKSARWRIVPLNPGSTAALDALRGGKPYVLPEVEATSLSRAFARTAERAGCPAGIHALRHTYCAHLVQAGVPLRTVQVLAGHASYATTERHYAHLAPGHLRDAVQSLTL